MPFHTVQEGECLSSIAKRVGLADYRSIWDRPENTKLGALRPWVIILLALCVLGACRRKESAVTDAAPKELIECNGDPRALIERVHREMDTHELRGALSPIFPRTWPPAGEPVALVYLYGMVPLPTSVDRAWVDSPFARLEVPLADATAIPRLTHLEARRVGAWTVNRGRASREMMEQAAAPLLDAICAGRLPGPGDATRLRVAYREWALVHGALANELRGHAPEFFAWIDAND
jgi:hypothetical protein